MTADPRFARRVVRLTGTSAVALGLVWFLWTATIGSHQLIGASLLSGWLFMPSVLGLSLCWPKIRYLVCVPAALVCLGLIQVCLYFLPDPAIARIGWILLTVGILMGAGLGAWFWYRLLPVPARLSDPFSKGRTTLITVHVALITAGLILVVMSRIL